MTHDELNALLDEPAIVEAIRDAEARGTGEVRVLVTHRAVADALAEARRGFASMGMEKTRHRNGVLIFIAPKSKSFAVLGDTGIDARGGERLWPLVVDTMSVAFREGRWTEGLVNGIRMIGDELARHFPPDAGPNPNELPDSLVRDASIHEPEGDTLGDAPGR